MEAKRINKSLSHMSPIKRRMSQSSSSKSAPHFGEDSIGFDNLSLSTDSMRSLKYWMNVSKDENDQCKKRLRRGTSFAKNSLRDISEAVQGKLHR